MAKTPSANASSRDLVTAPSAGPVQDSLSCFVKNRSRRVSPLDHDCNHVPHRKGCCGSHYDRRRGGRCAHAHYCHQRKHDHHHHWGGVLHHSHHHSGPPHPLHR